MEEEDIWSEQYNIWDNPEELTEENVVIEQERVVEDEEENDEWFNELMSDEQEPESIRQIRSDPTLKDWVPMAPPKKVGDTAKYAYNYLNQKGLPNHVSAGIVGNLLKESNLNPRIKDGDKRGGIGGIAQWDPTRSRNLINYSQQNGQDPYSLETQLDFVLHESKQRGDLDKTLQTKSPEEAALVFGRNYERPNEKYADWGTRQSYARGLTQQYGGIKKAQYGDAIAGYNMVQNLPDEFYLQGISNDSIQQYLQDENYEVDLEQQDNNTLGTIANGVEKAVQIGQQVNQFKNQAIDQARRVASTAIDVASEQGAIQKNALSLRKFNAQKNNKKYQLNTTNQNNVPIFT